MEQAEANTNVFANGDAVEIRTDEPGFAGAWFEATVLRKVKKKRLSVEYLELLEDDDESKRLREVVDVGSVRPRRPPDGARREFTVGDKVEALFNDGWWMGEVVGVVEDDRYAVKFIDSEILEIEKADLRTRLDWVEGEWVQPPKTDRLWWLGEIKRKKRTLKRMSSSKVENQSKEISTLSIVIQRSEDHGIGAGQLCQIRGVADDVIDMLKGIDDYSIMDPVNDIREPHFEGVLYEGIEFVRYGLRQCGRLSPIPVNIKDPVLQIESYFRYEGMSKQMSKQCSALIPYESGNSYCKYDHNCLAKLVDDKVMTKVQNVDSSAHMSDESQEIYPLMGTLESAGAVDHSGDKCLLEQAPLLFLKTSPLWETLESMDVFARLPQNPHFLPLMSFLEDEREGSAIGLMVNFVNFVENMQQSQFADPLSIFLERLVILKNLEHHGFRMQGMHSHLLEIIRLKKIQEQYDRDLVELEEKILRRKQDKLALLGHLNETDKNMELVEKLVAVVQQNRSSFREQMEIRDFKRSLWEKEGKRVKAQISIMKKEFHTLAVQPLLNSG